jgi:SAM-dependent methyltransferase
MSYKIDVVFPKSAEQYISLQCNSKLSDYTECPELAQLHELLSTKQPKRVLELGAGLGRGSVFLKRRYNWNETEFFLADGNSGTQQIAGIHYQLEPGFYNSMVATCDFCLANGIAKDKLYLINLEAAEIPDAQFDLCFSIKSIGFHWPINEYLSRLRDKIAQGATLLFELRNPQGYTPERVVRLSKYVKMQLEGIDSEVYKVVRYDEGKQFPMLVLERC